MRPNAAHEHERVAGREFSEDQTGVHSDSQKGFILPLHRPWLRHYISTGYAVQAQRV